MNLFKYVLDSQDMEKGMHENSSENLDIKFYGIWYEDLHHLTDEQLELHWLNNGLKEGRALNVAFLGEKMYWPSSINNWALGIDNPKFTKKEAKAALLLFIQKELIGGSRLERNPALKSIDFDSSFYGSWYEDLSEWPEDQLKQHWTDKGKSEGRFCSFKSLIESKGFDVDQLPSGFDIVGYSKLNESVKRLKDQSVYKLAYDYITKGKKLRKSYYFDPFFYAAFYNDLSPDSVPSALLAHFKKYGAKEKRFPNLEIYLQSTGGDRLTSYFGSKICVNDVLRWNPHLQATGLTDIIVQLTQMSKAVQIRLFEAEIQNAQLYAELATFLSSAGSLDLAIEALHTSLSFHPLTAVYEELSFIYEQRGQSEMAYAFAKEAIDLGSERIDVLDRTINRDASDVNFHDVDKVMRLAPTYNVEGKLSSLTTKLWNNVNASNKVLAIKDDRERIAKNTAEYAQIAIEQFSDFYQRFSGSQVAKQQLLKKNILIIGDQFIPQCIRYRLEQKEEQLSIAGLTTKQIAWTSKYEDLAESILFSDIIIFYRCPAFPELLRLIEKSKALGKLCIYEIDDLIFSAVYPSPLETYGALIGANQYTELKRSFQLYAEMAKACHFAIGSTQTITNRLSELVLFKKAFIHRNALDKHSIVRAKNHTNNKKTIDVFYGSATLAHNSDFANDLFPVLKELLILYPNLRLIIVGHLALGNLMSSNLSHRVKQLPYIADTSTYLEVLGQSDINVAVLDKNEMTDAKSEIKWLEAGALGIPSVVSATSNYCDVIQEGKTGFLAKSRDEWRAKLIPLIESSELRNSIGRQTKEFIEQHYSEESISLNLNDILTQMITEFELRKNE